MSNYIRQATADYFFRPSVTAPIRPTSLVMSLWVSVTDALAGTGVELTSVSAPGYVRSACTWGTLSLPSGVLSTNFVCSFPTATADWPLASFYGVHDQLGQLVHALTALTVPTTVLTGNHAEASAGALTVTLT